MKNTTAIKCSLILLLCTFIFNPLFAQERSSLWPRYKKTSVGKLYGFFDQKQRKFIIDPQYKMAGTFNVGNNRIAPVQNLKNEWGYINEKNEIVIPFTDKYAHASLFVNDYAIVWNQQKKMGLISREGKIVVEMIYDELGSNYGGLVPAKNERGKYGYITPNGEIAIDFKFDKAYNFVSSNEVKPAEFAKVLLDKKTGKMSLVNTKGEVLNYTQTDVEGAPYFQIYDDLAVVSYYNEDKRKHFYAVINSDGEEIIKNADAQIQAWESKKGKRYFILKEKAMRLNKIKTCNPYDHDYFRIRYKNNISPTDLVVDLVSVYDNTGKVVFDRSMGYNFLTPQDGFLRVGRAFSMDGKAAARFGLMDWQGKEVLKTLYYEVSWDDNNKIGMVGIDKMMRIEQYLDHIPEEKRQALKEKYFSTKLSSQHLYFINQDMKCVTKRLKDLDASFDFIDIPESMIDENAVFNCKYAKKIQSQNYSLLKKKDREIISEGPEYEPLPFSFNQPTKVLRIYEDGPFKVAPKQTKDFEFREGLVREGDSLNMEFRYVLARNGQIIPFNKEGLASPNYLNLDENPQSSITSFYSWFEGLQNSINVGLFLAYQKPGGSMTYEMRDWSNNTIIQPDVKYRLKEYLYNGLLWLTEIHNPEKHVVWNANNYSVIEIPLNESLKKIYQTADNEWLFLSTNNGKLYKMSATNANPKRIAENIGWVFIFQNTGHTYLMVMDSNTRKYGVIDAEGKTVVPRMYNHIQTNFNSENPNLFLAKDNRLFTYHINNGQLKHLKNIVSFNNGYRRAFGKYGVCRNSKNEFCLIDENGHEALKIKAEEFYGQPGKLSMAKQNGRWLYVDEAGKNPFNRDFVDIYPFNNGLALVLLDGNKNAFINTKGEFVIGPFSIQKN